MILNDISSSCAWAVTISKKNTTNDQQWFIWLIRHKPKEIMARWTHTRLSFEILNHCIRIIIKMLFEALEKHFFKLLHCSFSIEIKNKRLKSTINVPKGNVTNFDTNHTYVYMNECTISHLRCIYFAAICLYTRYCFIYFVNLCIFFSIWVALKCDDSALSILD